MRQRLDKITDRVETARTKLAEHPNHTRLQRRLEAAEADLAETLALYDSTPGGQDDLQTAIDAAPTPETREELTRRLEAAQRLRAEQTEALRRARAGTPDSDDDDGHENGATDVRRTDDAGAPGSVLEAVRVEPGPAGRPTDEDRAVLDRSGDPGSRSPRLLIDGRHLDPVATHELPAHVRDDLAAQGMSSPTLYELAPSDAGVYREQMLDLTRKNPYAASVHVYEEDEYQRMRLLVTDDGKAGVSINDDEIVSAFAHKDCAHPKAVQSMLRQATALGGRRLDCFDTVLPKLYADAGFVPVARLRWNDDYAPDSWDYERFSSFNGGRPDVVFMAYDPDRVGGTYTRGAGEYVDDYDDGIDRARNHTPS